MTSFVQDLNTQFPLSAIEKKGIPPQARLADVEDHPKEQKVTCTVATPTHPHSTSIFDKQAYQKHPKLCVRPARNFPAPLRLQVGCLSRPASLDPPPFLNASYLDVGKHGSVRSVKGDDKRHRQAPDRGGVPPGGMIPTPVSLIRSSFDINHNDPVHHQRVSATTSFDDGYQFLTNSGVLGLVSRLGLRNLSTTFHFRASQDVLGR